MKIAKDWTSGPAKWAAAILLAGASMAGMAWSLSGNRQPVRVIPAERTTQPQPQSAPAPPPVASPAPAAAQAPANPPDPAPAAVAPPPTTHTINLNTASQAELELLPGVGPAMAKRIMEYRSTHGKFTSVEQLDGVKGIGPKTMAKLRPLVSVD